LVGIITLVLYMSQPVVALTSLVTGISTKRLNNGAIVITGIAKLPVGTKLMVDLLNNTKLIGQVTCSVGNGGHFEAGNFTNGGKPWPIGSYKVRIISYFTKIWQPQQVLVQVGENGSHLPSSSLIPDDPEFPKSGGHLEITTSVSFPSIPADALAIQIVQESKLNVTGKGRSVSSVKEVVEYFKNAGGFKSLSWSAKQDGNGNWVITLDCLDAGNKKQAQWSFNPKSREVKYLDPLAKELSWLPAE